MRQISRAISGAKSLGRLVENEQVGIGHQRAADGEHLLFAAGELVPAVGKPFG